MARNTTTKRPKNHPSDNHSALVLWRNYKEGRLTAEAADTFALTQSEGFYWEWVRLIELYH
jgi:hypothetical protein